MNFEHFDQIILKGMNFPGHVGVLEIEKEIGQIFIVDIVFFCERLKACASDQLDDTIDYCDAFVLIRQVVEKADCDLLEHLAEMIAAALLERFPLAEAVEVTVSKPQAPIDGQFDAMGVKIFRERQPVMTVQTNEWHTVYLSIGSNLGDRLLYLHEALQNMELHEGVKFEAVSSVYETDPVGLLDQPVFLNVAVRISTTLPPMELLKLCQDIENHFQRDRNVHWGPRTLDIDLLTYDDLIVDTAALTLPHPLMFEREFVAIPLREIETGEIGCTDSVRPLYTNWYIH